MMHSFQQMQLLLVVHILVLVWVQSTWMKLVALAMRPNLLNAPVALQLAVHLAIQRMLECDVKVWRNSVMMLRLTVASF